MASHGLTSLVFSLQTDPWYYCITWAMSPSFVCTDGSDYYVDFNKPARSVENVIASRTFPGIKTFWYRDCANLFDFRVRRVGISRATFSLWSAITPHSRCPPLDRRQPYIISRAENPGQLISRHLAVATSRLAVRDGSCRDWFEVAHGTAGRGCPVRGVPLCWLLLAAELSMLW